MNFLRTTVINLENNMHQVIIWVFNLIHTTIDCLDAIIGQWVVEEDIKVEQDNNRKNKIGY